MYKDALDWLLNIQSCNYDFTEEESLQIEDLEIELRNPTLNNNDILDMYHNVQQVVFKYSNDEEDLDELIGYTA